MNEATTEDGRMAQDLADLNRRQALYQQHAEDADRIAAHAVVLLERYPANLEAEQHADLTARNAAIHGELAAFGGLTLERVRANPAEARRTLNGNIMAHSIMMSRLEAIQDQIDAVGRDIEGDLLGRSLN